MNYHALNSGCHFSAWPDGMVPWTCLFPSTAAGCSQTWGETGTFTLVLPLKPPGAFWVWPNTNNLKGFSPQWFPPPYWKYFEEGALGLVRNQGQPPSDCHWCQIESPVDMVVLSRAVAEDFTVPHFWLPTAWKELIILFSHAFPKFSTGTSS